MWTVHDAPWIQPWRQIVNKKVHQQPTLEKVIKAAHRELYRRFDYTPDYDPERKKTDYWSMFSGLSEHEIRFRGDCEDYALLIAANLVRHVEPGNTFILVGSSDDGIHAVLLVRDDEIDYVIDSRFGQVFKNKLSRDFKPRLALDP